ncbi:MAG: carbohydrate kinase [Anaerolineae bacterium]|nr:carbohydrate kinase [Anaerolineae bacterium]
MTQSEPNLDLLAIGEVLIDFISMEVVDSLREADTFRRYLGGSPANIAVNMAKLGCQAAIAGKTGIGAFGQFIKAQLQFHGVITDHLIMDHRVHTTFVFVSRTSGTPDFEPSRNGDYKIQPEEIADEVIAGARIVHASTWPLSREPSRSTVKKAFELAAVKNLIVSFDPNFSPIVWPNYVEAQEVMRDIYQYVTITKASLDDAQRFFGPDKSPEQYIKLFHELGPKIVVFTMGKGGSMVSENGTILGHLPARQINVVDATGAGDAFWAGFLTALLDEQPLPRCLLFAREVVELKLQAVGPLPNLMSRDDIYARLPRTSDLGRV